MKNILDLADSLQDSTIVKLTVAAVWAGLMIGLVTLAILQPENPFVL